MSLMAELDNPAGRLHQFLAAAQETDGNQNAGVALGKMLGANYPNQLGLLLELLAAVVRLSEGVRQDLRALGQDDELYFEPLDRAEAAFAGLHLNAPLSSFQSLISESTLYGLKVCSSILHKHRPRPLPEAATIDKLRRSMHDLAGEVHAADIDEELRLFLLEQLQSMIRATQMYRIAGREVLEAAVDQLIGTTSRRSDVRDKLEPSSFGKRLKELALAMALALSLVNDSFQLVHNAFPPSLAAPLVVEVDPSPSGAVSQLAPDAVP